MWLLVEQRRSIFSGRASDREARRLVADGVHLCECGLWGHTSLCPSLLIGFALLYVLTLALLSLQVRLIREHGIGCVPSHLNKTWGKGFNQRGRMQRSQAAGTNTPAIHHTCPHTNDKPKRRQRATSFHNQSVFIHDMSIN